MYGGSRHDYSISVFEVSFVDVGEGKRLQKEAGLVVIIMIIVCCEACRGEKIPRGTIH